MPQFPDVELALCELLADIAPTYTTTPGFSPDGDNESSESAMDLPLIAVARLPGGGADRLGITDTAIVEVACFATLRPDSQALNAAVRERLIRRRNVATAAGDLDSIDESAAPAEIPYDQVDTRRVPSTWTVKSRDQQ